MLHAFNNATMFLSTIRSLNNIMRSDFEARMRGAHSCRMNKNSALSINVS